MTYVITFLAGVAVGAYGFYKFFVDVWSDYKDD